MHFSLDDYQLETCNDSSSRQTNDVDDCIRADFFILLNVPAAAVLQVVGQEKLGLSKLLSDITCVSRYIDVVMMMPGNAGAADPANLEEQQ